MKRTPKRSTPLDSLRHRLRGYFQPHGLSIDPPTGPPQPPRYYSMSPMRTRPNLLLVTTTEDRRDLEDLLLCNPYAETKAFPSGLAIPIRAEAEIQGYLAVQGWVRRNAL